MNKLPCEPSKRRENEIIVNEQTFFAEAIKKIMAAPAKKQVAGLADAVIYSMLPRTFAAWDFNQKDKVEGGTLLGCIVLLPWLKKLNINIIYLLPVFEMGLEAKKGELSSPYSIKDIMKIDPCLHSELLYGITPEEEFAAFCEAAHHMGFKIMLDFVFRTCSRDNVLVRNHPDWFYWIDEKYALALRSPGTDDGQFQIVGHDNIAALYGSKDMPRFLDYFEYPPTAEQWKEILEQYDEGEKTLSEITAQKTGKVVLTGFADTINDPQPPWTDVTYYKYYFEPCDEVKALVDIDSLPPFLAQDGIKCSVFPANKPNKELWEYIAGVIPYYINKFGLDGARIDMAHALPSQLGADIINNIRAVKPDFLLWSEEFSPKRAGLAKAQGYDFILGDCFGYLGKITAKFTEGAVKAEIPVTAALETPDTPRIFYTMKKDEKAVLQA
ncbi:MAG: hypothetical protein IJL87_05185, partial [Clostridia bacterium]|nr:hypothetical protein [Clostridia bacterium]